MSTLIVELPDQAGQDMAWALSPDGHVLAGHGRALPALLPRADERVAVVPWRRLSWHRVSLPRVPAGRLRAALDGLLEEALLDDAPALHLALAPGARPGEDAWVCACDRAWLRAHLDALAQAGHPVDRITPEWTPDSRRADRVVGEPGDAWLLQSGRRRRAPRVSPLHSRENALTEWLPADDDAAEGSDDTAPGQPDRVVAEPAVAALAEQWFGNRVEVRPRSLQLVACAGSSWNLAQFDLAAAVGGRWGARLARHLRAFALGRPWRAARWGLAAALLVQLIGLNAWAWRQHSLISQRQTEARAVLTDTFPQVRLVIDAPVQMERELAALRGAAGALSPRDLEYLLGIAASVLPAGASPTGVEFQPGELRLKGLALAPAQLDQAQARLGGPAAPLRLRSEGNDLIIRSDTPRP